MRYAIIAAAWLTAWGAFASQDVSAGFVLCVDDAISSALPVQAADRTPADDTDPSPSRDTILVYDNVLGVIEVPSGAQAPSQSQHSRVSLQACSIATTQESLHQSSISSRLPLNLMFSPRMMYKSAVFRPPRA